MRKQRAQNRYGESVTAHHESDALNITPIRPAKQITTSANVLSDLQHYEFKQL